MLGHHRKLFRPKCRCILDMEGYWRLIIFWEEADKRNKANIIPSVNYFHKVTLKKLLS